MTNDLITSRGVIEMLTVANEFCHFTENAENYEQEEISSFYVKICPLLYLKGTLLPNIEADDDFPGERFVQENDWEIVFNVLREKLGDKDVFTSFSENEIDEKPINTSIAENIADIYQDLKDFVILYQSNLSYQKQNAISDCKELFINRWGAKIANILPALHKLVFQNNENDFL